MENKDIPMDLSDYPDYQKEENVIVKDNSLRDVVNKKTLNSSNGKTKNLRSKNTKKTLPKKQKKKSNVIQLVLLTLVAIIAVLFLIRSIHQMIFSAFSFSVWYGYVVLAASSLVLFIVIYFVAKDIISILRMKSYEETQKVFISNSHVDKRYNEFNEAIKQAGIIIEHIRKTDAEITPSQINSAYKDIDFAERIGEIKEAIEDNLLSKADNKIKEIIGDEAVNVAIGTIISPYGFLDALIVLYRNIRMIKKIIFIYNIKPGLFGLFRIFRNVTVNVATAGLMQEASALTLAGIQSFPINILGRATMQGLSSAFLTIRIGLITQNICRPIVLDKNRYGELMSALLKNTKDKMKSLINKLGS